MENNFFNHSEDIRELVWNNFKIKNNELYLKKIPKLHGLIIIYAPWCSSCASSVSYWDNKANLFRYKFDFFAYNSYNHDDHNQNIGKYFSLPMYPQFLTYNNDGKLEKIVFKNENERDEWISANSI
jgi:hypothetical protein